VRISVFGLGCVGTVCAACLADRGNQVIGVDKAKNKVASIRSRQAPVVERDTGDLVARNVQNGRLSARIDAADLTVADIAEAVYWAETIVTPVSAPGFETGIAGARPDQAVLNLARFSSVRRPPVQEGFLC
jgi:UDP-glucose 6-dehydrogenase